VFSLPRVFHRDAHGKAKRRKGDVGSQSKDAGWGQDVRKHLREKKQTKEGKAVMTRRSHQLKKEMLLLLRLRDRTGKGGDWRLEKKEGKGTRGRKRILGEK